MKALLPFLVPTLVVALLAGCFTTRRPFTPQSGPPTVGMPAELSDRENSFVHRIESSLQDRGYVAVRHGAGDYQLEFEIAEGPINIDTRIELLADGRSLALGEGRGSGAPLLKRDEVAERSFEQAFQAFDAALPGATQATYPADTVPDDAGYEEYVY